MRVRARRSSNLFAQPFTCCIITLTQIFAFASGEPYALEMDKSYLVAGDILAFASSKPTLSERVLLVRKDFPSYVWREIDIRTKIASLRSS